MSMRVGNTTNEYLNSVAGRSGIPEENQRISRTERIDREEPSKVVSSLSGEELASLSGSSRGVVQTRVSPDNSFQKNVISDPSIIYERMAAKLMDKLPRILDDMQRLVPEDSRDVILAAKKADMDTSSKKVVISEDGRIRGEAASAPGTEDISL